MMNWQAHDVREELRTGARLFVFALAFAVGLAVSMGGGAP